MKTKYIIKGVFTALALMLTFSSCDTFQEEVIDTLDVNRAFSPIELKATVRNETSVELNWTVKPDADHYVVQFSADDIEFKTIYKTVNVAPDELPVKVQLEGETVYSIRVKAVSSTGLEDSKWSVTTATTLSEQLLYAVLPADIEAKQVTLRWPANTNATQITLQPGNVTHTITAAEKTAGVAVVTGLTSETAYTATLLNGTKKRGTATFTTGIDIGTGILIKADDNLLQKIIDAPAGSVLVLMPGDYIADNQVGTININKEITLRGLRVDNKPKLHVNFVMVTGSANLSLIDLDLKGDKGAGAAAVSVIKYNDNSVSYGDLLISGCNIHDYGVSLISANLNAAKVSSITVDNSIVTNILTANGEFIDFRGSQLAKLTLKNSTFNNVATARYFIRADAGLTGLTSTIVIDACTINNPNMIAANTNGILYTRFVTTSSITVRNTLFSNTAAPYTRETATPNPTFVSNNYFNCPNLNSTAGALANNRPDLSATATALDPQFVSAATGNFKVQNQTLIDNKIGDPRWLK
ncbi:DUF5123 domain-containing protein [Flavobacterium sp. ASV13]|uniref:DUF5123 domain-containing protein n=1 Tax=Flavobacterium sp. ASV13 TaxID=1506583 RepID=UPI000552F422|nr:DUF4957 domain-containing protein [Flavobacterium sp. ASV13]